MILTAALTAGALAYDAMTREARTNLKVTKQQLKQYANLSKEIDKTTKAALAFSEAERLDIINQISSVSSDTYKTRLQTAVLTGQMTQLEADILESKNKQRSAQSDISSQLYLANLQREKDIKDLENKLKLLDDESRLLSDIRMNTQSTEKDRKEAIIRQKKIEEETKKIKETIQEITRIRRKDISISVEIDKVTKQRGEAERKLIRAQQAKNRALQKEQELQDRLKEGRTAIMSFDEQAEAARQASKDIMMSVLPVEEQIAIKAKEQVEAKTKQIEEIEAQLRLLEATAKTEEERLQLSFAEESAAAAITEIKKEQQLIEEEGLLKISELRDQLSEKTKQQSQDESADRRKQIDDDIKYINMMSEASIGTFRNTTNAIGELIKITGAENANTVKALFEMNKVASIGEIAFNTATAITAAQKYPPPFNGLMIASAVAAGAAQGAVVMSQQAPQFHMGGMTPDESIAVVKAGEAVLDRATVDRLGGEPGINQTGQPEVIVMNPYKHFDRYMTDRQRAGLSSRSARRGY
jgi:chromosome segregation ATPase